MQQPKHDTDYAKLVSSICSPNPTLSDTSENASSVAVKDRRLSAKEMMKEILGHDKDEDRKSEGDADVRAED